MRFTTWAIPVIAAVGLLAHSTRVHAATHGTVAVNPPSSTVSVGQTFTVTIVGQGFDQVTEGGGVNLAFDPTRLHVTAVSVDSMTWEFFTQAGVIDNNGGTVSNILFASFAGRSGNFTVATVSLQAIAAGSSALQLTESALNPFASGGQHLAVAFASGAVKITTFTPSVPVGTGGIIILSIALLAGGALLARRRRALAPFVALLAAVGWSAAARAAADTDGDGVPDAIDNCVVAANPGQADADGDGFGNLCDADINNDGFVNSLDLGLFKNVFGKQDPVSDLNSDGLVNSLDLGTFKNLFAQAPGPSNVKLSSALAQNPPPVTHLDLFTLDRTLPDGSNGAAFYTFGIRDQGGVISMVFGRALPFNDLGLEPDQKAGDGVYSGFVTINADAFLNDESDYQKRLGPAPQVWTYSGRDVTGQRPFSLTAGNGAAAPAVQPIVLPSGIMLSPVVSRLAGLIPLSPTASPTRSLTITDKSVVADPSRTFDPCDVDGDGSFGNVNGAWSFKTLMANMANGLIPTQQFVHDWLLNWMSTQTVGSSPFTIAPRTAIKNFFPPSAGSPGGWDGVNASTLDLNALPFRLLAIVNRMDLAGASFYGSPANPRKSETRFVFGLVDRTATASCKASGNIGATRRMTVIFEYGDPTSNCTDLQARAKAWIALAGLPFPSAAYNAALQSITNSVTTANAAPTKPNGSALDQLRTNEIALFSPWELREFGLTLPFSSLQSATIKQTPDPGTFRMGSAVTAQFWQLNADAILCETHVVPDLFMGSAFLGTHADYGFGTFWDAPAVISGAFPSCWKSNVSSITQPTKKGEVRHKFSLNTCDDCHSGETSTVFTHVDPQSTPSMLSGFLTGITVSDPGGEPVQRTFNDLARRGQSLEDQALGCFKLPISFAAQQAALTLIH